MQGRLKREELDHLAAFHALDEQGVNTLLNLARARPDRGEAREFIGQALSIGGLLSLAAALVFFIAANWSRIAVFGRFAIVELVLLACGALALWRPPPSFIGRGALLLAFVATGTLLALFGQTYQTGADVYELFVSWTLLGLLFAIAARWSVVTAAWVLVLNVALLLYCGWQPAGGMLWMLLGSSRVEPADLVIGAAWLNLLLWVAAEWRQPAAVPQWVCRLLVTSAFLFASWAGILVVFADETGFQPDVRRSLLPVAPLGLLAAWALTVILALRWRRDIYPLVIVLGSFLVVSTAFLADLLDTSSEGVFLLFAVYLIVVSALGARMLLGLLRRWRVEGAA